MNTRDYLATLQLAESALKREINLNYDSRSAEINEARRLLGIIKNEQKAVKQSEITK